MSQRHCDEEGLRTAPGTPDHSRRRVVGGMVGGAAIIAAGGLSGLAARAAEPPLFIIDFLAFSSRVTGVELDRTYIQLGELIWSLLTLGGDEASWRKLVRTGLSGDDDGLAERIGKADLYDALKRLLSVWYTGTIDLDAKFKDHPAVLSLFAPGDEPVVGPGGTFPCVVTYDDALAWRACAFTKPPSTCGGPFGYWQNAG